ncbi:MAG: orotidine-5'-phosphate decarboxylase [Saprospiraceae bacterium]|jgi:orotidine-5'-phosphate decarboxylase
MRFIDSLKTAWQQQNSLVCVGLDPDIKRLPVHLGQERSAIFEFNKQLVDATAEYACCFKPQIAYYAAVGAEGELEKTIAYIKQHYPTIPVILDAKRGDIGATADMYAVEAFGRYGADALTVNPYMGGDTIEPYLAYKDKGVVVLCRTSNSGSGEFQSLQADGEPLAWHVAKRAVDWNKDQQVMLVVGATYPEELGQIRELVGDMPLLVPGIGAQGGDLAAVMQHGVDSEGLGLMINSSRGIIYASSGKDFAAAAANEAKAMRDQINVHR